MRALYKHHAGSALKFDPERPKPACGPRDVLVRVSKVGICGTDRHIWEWDLGRRPHPRRHRHRPRVRRRDRSRGLGRHQVQARACASPPKATSRSGADYNSRTGNAHIASDTRIIGIDRDGCFADYVVVPEENVWPVHASIPDKVAAVLDPLGNAVHTVMAAASPPRAC
jgi:threonine 3-dehydrogenase